MEQRNLVIALVLSVLVLVGWEYYISSIVPKPVPPSPAELALPALTPAAPVAAAPRPRATVLGETKRAPIMGQRVHGSINLAGARFDDLTLADYRETTDPKSSEIELLSPLGTAAPYYAAVGWRDAAGRELGADALWTAAPAQAGAKDAAVLVFRSAEGLSITRRIAVDADFLITVTDTVVNEGTAAQTLVPFAQVRRIGRPKTDGYYILHEGPLGVFNATLKEVNYKDLDATPKIEMASTGGWIGITDKYWLAAAIPDQAEPVTARFAHAVEAGVDAYTVETLGRERRLEPGASVVATQRVFAGAKEVRLLDRYSAELGIARFDLAIDFGWFFYITKPMFYALLTLHEWLGNFGLAILVFTVFVKALFFPLANKSYRSMSRMKALQPKLLELRARYEEDKLKLQQEMMALYKREKVNPLAGCLPIVVQVPVFFALYKVLFVTIEMRHAPFFGWIIDLSAADPTSVFNLFGLLPWAPPETLLLPSTIGAWPFVMGVTMFLQTKLNPAPPDPVQAKMFAFMPLIFTPMMAMFPAGLVIYWTWNNLLSITQQYVIMRSMGVPIGGAASPPQPARKKAAE
ncbi:MAG: membrane protein insertase YidC [Alphaproteobacteria bacterium]|nr:membrane protein insertase YidC [Alphaproteobacteria bacterium]